MTVAIYYHEVTYSRIGANGRLRRRLRKENENHENTKTHHACHSQLDWESPTTRKNLAESQSSQSFSLNVPPEADQPLIDDDPA